MRYYTLGLLACTLVFTLLAAACDQSGSPSAGTAGTSSSGGSSSGGGGGSGGGGSGGTTGLTLTSTALPLATVGQFYSTTLPFSGAAAAVTVNITSGAFPPGVNMTSAGNISGSPALTGQWGVQIEATDGVTTIVAQLSLTVQGITGSGQLENQLRQVIAQKNIQPMPQPPGVNQARVELGRNLFFDKELSGNRDVSCSTCHHPRFNYGDGLNLSVGVGGTGGIGPGRDHPTKTFVPRHAPAVYNTTLMPELFWDKRVGVPPPPPGQQPGPTQTPEGPTNLTPLAAQALFPMVSLTEMRGTGHSLDGLSDSAYRDAIANRLAQYNDYVSMFTSAFGAGNMTVDNMVIAIAEFERSQTYANAPWDRYLRGDNNALTDAQKRGASIFFGPGGCDACHSGPLLTNFTTHNIIIPQFGPGQGQGVQGREDFGFENTTGNQQNRYQFRVPSLRNVAITAPYMHNGAFSTLTEVVNHYRNKAASTNGFTGQNMVQAADLAPTLLPTNNVLQTPSQLFLNVPGNLSPQQVQDIVAFLEALTDPAAVNRMSDIPNTVPSGLAVDR
ncbi:MAG: c-type cytochrome [Planctomycetes bacterium]|nr:c-type cytochrome [Planctomycetota bacterium]